MIFRKLAKMCLCQRPECPRIVFGIGTKSFLGMLHIRFHVSHFILN